MFMMRNYRGTSALFALLMFSFVFASSGAYAAPSDLEAGAATEVTTSDVTTTDVLAAEALDMGYAKIATWRDIPRPSRIVAGSDGMVYIISAEEVRRHSPDGAFQRSTTSNGAREIAVDDASRVYGLRSNSVFQLNSWGAEWTKVIPGEFHPLIGDRPPYLSAMAWNGVGNRVSVVHDMDKVFVTDYAPAGATSGGLPLRNSSPPHVYWDIDFHAGEAFVLNRSTNFVEVYSGDTYVTEIPLPARTERIAVGPEGTVFALSGREWVYRVNREGGVLDAWDATDGIPGAEVFDITVDPSGRVYLVDGPNESVRVYGLAEREDPTISPPPPPDMRCQMVVDKTADPTYLRLGEMTQVTLSLGGTCPQSSEKADIVLVVDRSNSMTGEKIEAARQSVIAFVDEMDLERDQVGLVSFQSTPALNVPLSQNYDAMVAAANGLVAEGGTNIHDAIDMAMNQLVTSSRWDDPLVKPIIVLMTDGVPFDITGLATVAAADRARYADITMFTIGLGDDVNPNLLTVLATDPAFYFFAPDGEKLKTVYQTIARRIAASVLMKSVRIVDVIPDNMRFRRDQPVEPAAAWDDLERTLTWEFAPVPFGGITMRYWLEPLEVGEWDTNVRADYDGLDGLDQLQIGPFPVPRVIVWDPSIPTATPPPTETPVPTATATATVWPPPTPTNTVWPPPPDTPTPTATSVPPSPTPIDTATSVPPSVTPVPPSATPTPDTWRIYLPIQYNDHCIRLYTDVALVIDASTTMLYTTDKGELKLHAAKEAAKAFLSTLRLEPDLDGRHDQAAIIWYNDSAGVVSALSHDRAALEAAIDAIEPIEGSRIDLGLQFGHRELLPEFALDRQISNSPALVLLSDGIPNRTSYEAVIAAADAAKVDGIEVHTVGLGRDVRRETLQRIASQPGLYYESPTGDDLSIIYERIAGDLVCR